MANKINLPNIESAIKKGLMKGYKENILLQSSYNSFHSKVAEYLLTICIAQNLLIWNANQNEHSRYKIFLEYPSKQFINNAFISSKYIDNSTIFNMNKEYRLKHQPFGKQSGRIDIAISEEDIGENLGNPLSLIGIEVKAINQNYYLILSDIERLSQMILETDTIGQNNINAGYCIFLENMFKEKNLADNRTISLLKSKCLQKWNERITKFNCDHGIKITTEVFDVEKSAEEDVRQSHKEQESDYEAVARDTGLVLGVLIKILRVTDD
ncbi:MAG: hypothetical protein RO257_14715 [Candidatus Kapabacteria bacterium]|nr:hypothetical protein [Candidatus Kapabacteria bacterium]